MIILGVNVFGNFLFFFKIIFYVWLLIIVYFFFFFINCIIFIKVIFFIYWLNGVIKGGYFNFGYMYFIFLNSIIIKLFKFIGFFFCFFRIRLMFECIFFRLVIIEFIMLLGSLYFSSKEDICLLVGLIKYFKKLLINFCVMLCVFI